MKIIESNCRVYPEFELDTKGRFKERCIFCGQKHTHGLVDGHRLAHCADHDKPDNYAIIDGYIFHQENGYYVKVTPKVTPNPVKNWK